LPGRTNELSQHTSIHLNELKEKEIAIMTREIMANRASTASVDMKFEVVVIPVADVDRAKAFYTKLGWRLGR